MRCTSDSQENERCCLWFEAGPDSARNTIVWDKQLRRSVWQAGITRGAARIAPIGTTGDLKTWTTCSEACAKNGEVIRQDSRRDRLLPQAAYCPYPDQGTPASRYQESLCNCYSGFGSYFQCVGSSNFWRAHRKKCGRLGPLVWPPSC